MLFTQLAVYPPNMVNSTEALSSAPSPLCQSPCLPERTGRRKSRPLPNVKGAKGNLICSFPIQGECIDLLLTHGLPRFFLFCVEPYLGLKSLKKLKQQRKKYFPPGNESGESERQATHRKVLRSCLFYLRRV